MSEPFKATGGIRLGWISASPPLAKLVATPASLRITVRILGDYTFVPDTVVSITRHTNPIFGRTIRIQHCVPEYPADFTFGHRGGPDILLKGIREAGFIARAPASAIPPRKGFALRWQTIAIALTIMYVPCIFGMLSGSKAFFFPGRISMVTLGLILAAAIATICAPAFRHLVLKPGRHVGEIRPFLNLTLFIGSILFVVFAIICIFNLGWIFKLHQP